MADRIGQQLGNYRLVRLLGHGGFADVYLGEHIHLDILAAIKVLHTELASQIEIENFRNEARIIAQLEHHHIVRVLDFGLQDNIPFLVINYAAKGSLRDLHPKGTILPQASIVLYVKQVAEALQYAHDKKLIHRDVKPENMLLGDSDNILLSDFGIAIRAHNTRSMIFQNEAGTIPYMAPEQIHGNARPASDQYALGIVVYEWLCGTYPFKGSYIEIATQHLYTLPSSLQEGVSSILPEIEQVVMKALNKDPKQRFVNVLAFATALEQAFQSAQKPLSSPSISTPQDQPTSMNISTEQLSQFTYISQPDEPPSRVSQPSKQLEATAKKAASDKLLQNTYQAINSSVGISHRLLRDRKLIASFIGIVLFLILIVIATIRNEIYKSNGQIQFDANATKTAQAVSRNIALSPKATVIPLSPQQAAVATARAITNSTPVFADDLSTNFISDWYVDYSNCTFTGGAYQARVKQANAFQSCKSSILSYGNAALQVDVSLLSGSDAGLILRATDQQFYEFGIDNQGHFFFRRHDPNGVGGGSFTDLIPATRSNAIVPGKRENTLLVIANGSDFKLFINGAFVGEQQDSNYTRGQVGFSVETFPSVKAGEASFSNFKVFSVSS